MEPHHQRPAARHARASSSYQDFSDFNFFRDFERDFDRNTLRFIDSRAFVTGNWGPHLLNLLLNRPRDVRQPSRYDTVTQRKLPELEYRLRSTRLGQHAVLPAGRQLGDYLDVSRRPGAYEGHLRALRPFPQLTLPVPHVPLAQPLASPAASG